MINLLSAIKESLRSNDRAEAVAIHNYYIRSTKARNTLMFILANSLSPVQGIPEDVRKSVISGISKTQSIPEGLPIEDAAMEAISLYQKDVNASISMESYPVIPKQALRYYIGSGNQLSDPPADVILRAALECIIDGRASGTTGREWFERMVDGKSVSRTVMATFSGIFDQEEEIVDQTDFDMLAESLEEFYVKDQRVLEKVKKAKIVRGPEFQKIIKEADIVIVVRKKDKNSNMLVQSIVQYVNRKVTGGTFSSAKIVGPQSKTIIGYGTKFGTMRVREVPIVSFLRTCEMAVALRHTQMTDVKRKEILGFMQKVMKYDPEYDFKSFFMTILKHESNHQHTLTKREAKKRAKAMICTSVLTRAFRSAGIDPKIDVTDNYVWPIDFIKSPAFEPVAVWVGPKVKI